MKIRDSEGMYFQRTLVQRYRSLAQGSVDPQQTIGARSGTQFLLEGSVVVL